MKRLFIFLTLIVVLLLVMSPTAAASPPSQCDPIYHQVRPGGTLYGIAARYGTSIQTIARANGITNLNRIYVGQLLIIPCVVPDPVPSKTGLEPTCIHIVRRGEWLMQIARRYGVSFWAIARVNGIPNPNLIYPGQRLVIPGCAPQPWPSPWDGGYGATPAELCPPDKEPVARPIFQDAIQQEQREGASVWVRRGLLANEQGETFRVEVIGPGKDAVQRYTDEVRVCFDVVRTSYTTSAKSDSFKPYPPLAPDVLGGANQENLIINIEFMGGSWSDLSPGMYTETLSTIRSIVNQVPAEKWGEAFQRGYLRFAPAQAWIYKYQRDYMVDFVIDPSIGYGGFHDYPAQCKQSAIVDLAVTYGAGSVTGYLYRNYYPVVSGYVAKGGFSEVVTLSHSSVPEFFTYDLGVWGNQNGSKYRISGRWWYSYGAAAPIGGGQPCLP